MTDKKKTPDGVPTAGLAGDAGSVILWAYWTGGGKWLRVCDDREYALDRADGYKWDKPRARPVVVVPFKTLAEAEQFKRSLPSPNVSAHPRAPRPAKTEDAARVGL